MADTPAPFSPFSTDEMLETIYTFKRPQNGLLKAFFPTVKQSNAKFHHFETSEEKRYVAPFVSPKAPSRARARQARRVTSVEAAYVKQRSELSPSEALERQAGETIGGSATPAQRRDVLVAGKLREQYDAVMRRMELMASSALITGKNVLEGEDYPRVELDYGRAVELGLDHPANTLTGTERWNQSTSNPGRLLRAAAADSVRRNGSWTPNIVMDIDAAEAFLDHPKVKERMDMLKLDAGTLQERAVQGEGLMPLGVYSSFNIWLYVGFYYDEATGDDLAMFAGGHVMGVGAIDGVEGYGAIEDWDAIDEYPDGLVPEAIYPKMYREKNPSTMIVETQCAPIVYPRRPNASWVRKVLG